METLDYQKKKLLENGYCIIRNFLDTKEIQDFDVTGRSFIDKHCGQCKTAAGAHDAPVFLFQVFCLDETLISLSTHTPRATRFLS